MRSRTTRIVGTPETIADQLELWSDAGVDGINVINATIPGSYEEFIDQVMPVLRQRGLARAKNGEPATLRHNFLEKIVSVSVTLLHDIEVLLPLKMSYSDGSFILSISICNLFYG